MTTPDPPDWKPKRRFLVIADGSEESPTAALFAGLRAAKSGAEVVVLRVIEPTEFSHWLGVGVEMREEAREGAALEAQALADMIEEVSGLRADIRIREGAPRDALRDALTEDPSVKVVVLASAFGRRGPGPLIAALAGGKPIANRPVAVTVVPGGLSLDEIRAMV